MVKFFFLRRKRGLRTDVERRFTDYLSGDSCKIQTVLVCSLLDIGSLPITDAFLEDIGLLREAYNLEHAILDQPSKGTWKTIHPRWDEEMLSFLYNESDGGKLYDNKQYLKFALDSIFNLIEKERSATQKRAYSVIGTIYDIGARGVIPLDIIESVINIPAYLTNEKKAELYTYYIAAAYRTLKKERIAINKFNEALTFRPNFIPALGNKGICLGNLRKYEEAIECFDRAIKIDPNDTKPWYNKGLWVLRELGKNEDEIICYDMASFHAKAWNNKDSALRILGKYEEAFSSL